MIHKIEITNFKSIGNTIAIELKPITLLFGPNSAGKSTIIQALHYAAEVLKGNFDPALTQTESSSSGLGSFFDIIHNHDTDKIIRLKFEISANDRILPGHDDFEPLNFTAEQETSNPIHEIFDNFDSKFDSARLTIEIAKNKASGIVRPSKYEIEINYLPFVTIAIEDSNPKNTYSYFSYINIDHPILNSTNTRTPDYSLFESATGMDLKNLALRISYSKSVLPLSNKIFLDSRYFDPEYFSNDNMKGKKDLMNLYRDLLRLICWATVSITDLLREDLNNLMHIGPIRELPSRNYAPLQVFESERWFNGLAAWDALYSSTGLINSTNMWMKKLEIPYTLKLVNLLELDEQEIALIRKQNSACNINLDQITGILNSYSGNIEQHKSELTRKLFELFAGSGSKLPVSILKNETYKKLYLTDKNNLKLLPNDLGTGISQVIPVIVAALVSDISKNSIIAIEQPELHIHPAVQVELADLFISEIRKDSAGPGKNFIIETHSEHIVLRLLRRIEEYSKGKKSEFSFSNTELNVYWCEPDEKGLKIELLPVDESGEFTRNWPKGFFEERARELFPDD